MTRDEKAILLKTDQEWAASASQGIDVERIISFWSDDAKIYPPRSPVVEGKQAIREFVIGSLKMPGFSVMWEPVEVVVAPGGDMGYTTGRNRFTIPDGSGNLLTMRGRYVTVWRRETSGTWKCVIDIWNSEPEE